MCRLPSPEIQQFARIWQIPDARFIGTGLSCAAFSGRPKTCRAPWDEVPWSGCHSRNPKICSDRIGSSPSSPYRATIDGSAGDRTKTSSGKPCSARCLPSFLKIMIRLEMTVEGRAICGRHAGNIVVNTVGMVRKAGKRDSILPRHRGRRCFDSFDTNRAIVSK